MKRLTREHIARICHIVNSEYCAALGDFSPGDWETASPEHKNRVRLGVEQHLASDVGPEASHAMWLEAMRLDGWSWGPEKDEKLKEHPNMVPFCELPREQRAKDYIFKALVDALSEFL